MLIAARDAGHNGRLYGLDPAPGMLAQARRRAYVEWVLGDLTSVKWDAEFDLVVMTGHAFQVFIEDDDICDALARIHSALRPDGRFAFETRNPSARAWETEIRGTVDGTHGEKVSMRRKVTTPFNGRVISFSHTFQNASWDAPRVSHSTLRFIGKADLDATLVQAGLVPEAQFGDWDESPLTETSPEIITIARRI